MKYDEALRAWGAIHLKHLLGEGDELAMESITVSMSARSGYGCSCSSDPTIEVTISGWTTNRRSVYCDRDGDWWSFEDFLKEVVEAANGAVTLD